RLSSVNFSRIFEQGKQHAETSWAMRQSQLKRCIKVNAPSSSTSSGWATCRTSLGYKRLKLLRYRARTASTDYRHRDRRPLAEKRLPTDFNHLARRRSLRLVRI